MQRYCSRRIAGVALGLYSKIALSAALSQSTPLVSAAQLICHSSMDGERVVAQRKAQETLRLRHLFANPSWAGPSFPRQRGPNCL